MSTILVVGNAPELEAALAARGHVVRARPAPEALGALLPELLPALAAKLVDTHVRGFACGPDGAEVAERFARTYAMPTAVVRDGDWVAAVESVIA